MNDSVRIMIREVIRFVRYSPILDRDVVESRLLGMRKAKREEGWDVHTFNDAVEDALLFYDLVMAVRLRGVIGA